MNLKPQKFNQVWPQRGTLLIAGLFAVEHATAGSILMTPPPVVATPPVVQEDEVGNEMNVFIPNGVSNGDSSQPFQYGPVTLHPHINYSFSYGSGIQSGVNNQQNSIIQQLSPGISADLGKHWSLDYTPTIHFYSNKEFRDGVDHSVSLSGSTHYEDWTFGLSQAIGFTSDPLTETASQTDQQQYTTVLSAGYVFSDKISADFDVNQGISLVSHLQDSYNRSTMDWLNYQFWSRFNVGLGMGAGYTKVSTDNNSSANNPDSLDEQLQARANWRATDKISFQVSAGLEDQQFLASGYDDSLNPIFSATIQYQPFQYTQISLAASRTVGASDYYVTAQSSETTAVSLSLSQRLLGKYNLNLGVAYTQTEFTTSYGSIGTSRTDDGYSFNASIGRNFLKRGNWAITYQYNDNESSVSGFGQQNHQIGFQIGYSY